MEWPVQFHTFFKNNYVEQPVYFQPTGSTGRGSTFGVPQNGSTKRLHKIDPTGLPHTPTRAYRPGPESASVTDTGITISASNAKKPRITIPDFLETLSAMQFARLVVSPVQDASGLMLIAPSGSLKSQLLMHLQRCYPSTCICDSNWHYGKLLNMRAAFFNGAVRSIVIPELASLYAGDPRTGGRMEAMLQQLAGEGCISTNETDSRYERYEMRASVFAAMTPTFARRKEKFWEEGFHRRFLWAHLAMENEEVLLDYLTAGKQADLDVRPIVEPPERFIPDTLIYTDRQFVRTLLSGQKAFGPNHTRFTFLCRTAAVLKWHYHRIGDRRNWRDTIRRFSVCLGEEAALLIVPDEPTAMKYRKQEEQSLLKLARTRKKKRHKAKPAAVALQPTTPTPEVKIQ